ncbi:MAG: FAD-dependent oxidoreductase [Chitinophagales bacterium]
MHVVIIGNGISGITCARHIRKSSNHDITVISYESNHFYSRTALMYIYMGHMRYQDTKPYEDWFWEKNRIDLVYGKVVQVQPESKQIQLSDGSKMTYDKLVIATGSSSNKFNWPGQDLPGVQGLYSLQDLEMMNDQTKNVERAVVIGGGLIGIEMAEMLLSRAIPVTMLVRESSFWNNVLPAEESEMINNHIRKHHIDLRLSSELKEIKADNDGKVGEVITTEGDTIKCQFVGLTVGVHPNIEFMRSSEIETNKGVLVNAFFETNIKDIYAIGDCAEFRNPLPGRKAIEQVWYTGKMHGATLAQIICGHKLAYQPGYWFNSAKFLDIEYQTYGTVPSKKDDSQSDFYWEHSSHEKSIRLVYDQESKRFLGANLFGIRYRHHLFNQFLEEERDIKYVIEHLPAANFDPEFYDQYEYFLKEAFNKRYPENRIQEQVASGLKSFFKHFKPSKV